MCKFVLLFAVVILLIVSLFTFFFRLGEKSVAPVRVPPEEVERMTPAELDQRILDLGQTLHGTPAPVVDASDFEEMPGSEEPGMTPTAQ